jgi:hypothetical protein
MCWPTQVVSCSINHLCFASTGMDIPGRYVGDSRILPPVTTPYFTQRRQGDSTQPISAPSIDRLPSFHCFDYPTTYHLICLLSRDFEPLNPENGAPVSSCSEKGVITMWPMDHA